MDNLITKLHLIKENPGYYNALSPEEQAELFIFLLTPKKKIFQKPVEIKGVDGITPVKDVDYLSLEASQKALNDLQKLVQDKLDTIHVEHGKDAVITPQLIDDILYQVLDKVEIPEYIPFDDSELKELVQNVQLDHEELRDEVETLKKNVTTQFVGGGVSANWVKNYVAQNQSAGLSETFETVSKNLDSSSATLSYTGDNLTSIVYTNGITKTLNYTGDNLTSVVLSGSTPSGIDLTKTLSYTGDNLTEVTYS